MKSKIIEPPPEPEKEDESGMGLECPNCEEDMRKVVKVQVQARVTPDGIDHDSAPSAPVFVCDACGYQEEVERG